MAGTEYTVGGTADVNLTCSTRNGRKVCTDSTLGAIHKLRAEHSISGVEVVAQDGAIGSDQWSRAGLIPESCTSGQEASTCVGHNGTAGIEHRNTAADGGSQSRLNTTDDRTDNNFAGTIRRTLTHARQDLGRTGSGTLITRVSTRVLDCGHALATIVHETAVSNIVGNSTDVGSEGLNKLAGDTADSRNHSDTTSWTPTHAE